MRSLKKILYYHFAIATMLTYEASLFISTRELIYRSIGNVTRLSSQYTFTSKEAIIYNSFGSLYNASLLYFLIKWFSRDKQKWVVITCVVAWIVFITLVIFEENFKV